MERFVVSHAPFIRSNNDINKMFLYLSIALMVPTIYGTMFFGVESLIVMFTSILSCFVFECLFNFIATKKFFVDNLSFFVTAMILGLTMPYKTPFYIVIAGAFFSIFIVKMAFGGLGRNKFNPALAGRCFVGLLSSGFTSSLYELTLNGEEYVSVALGGTNSISSLLLGQGVGGIGTTCVLVILICYIFLVYTGVLDFKIPLLSILSYFVVGLLIGGLETTVINMFSGSFIFVSVFMMTDPNTSPNTTLGKILYSVLFGALSALVWNVGSLGENTIFVVALFVNVLVPFMDKYFVWKPLSLGGFRNAYKN